MILVLLKKHCIICGEGATNIRLQSVRTGEYIPLETSSMIQEYIFFQRISKHSKIHAKYGH